MALDTLAMGKGKPPWKSLAWRVFGNVTVELPDAAAAQLG